MVLGSSNRRIGERPAPARLLHCLETSARRRRQALDGNKQETDKPVPDDFKEYEGFFCIQEPA